MDPKVREILQAIADDGNLSLAACLWSAHREKTCAYTQNTAADPFQPIYEKAAELLGRPNPEVKPQRKESHALEQKEA